VPPYPGPKVGVKSDGRAALLGLELGAPLLTAASGWAVAGAALGQRPLRTGPFL